MTRFSTSLSAPEFRAHVPVHFQAGGIQPASVTDPQRTDTLSAQNPPTQTAPPTSCSNRWISWPAWWLWYPDHASTSLAFMEYSHPSKYRARVTPAKRGRRKKIVAPNEAREQTPAEQRSSMTWAKRLKRVFNIDIETCSKCGGEVKIIASIRPHGCGR